MKFKDLSANSESWLQRLGGKCRSNEKKSVSNDLKNNVEIADLNRTSAVKVFSLLILYL